MQERKLSLGHGFEVEEYSPAAGIANEIWGKASVEVLDWLRPL